MQIRRCRTRSTTAVFSTSVLAACPGYARATASLQSVDIAREQAEEFRNLGIQHGRR